MSIFTVAGNPSVLTRAYFKSNEGTFTLTSTLANAVFTQASINSSNALSLSSGSYLVPQNGTYFMLGYVLTQAVTMAPTGVASVAAFIGTSLIARQDHNCGDDFQSRVRFTPISTLLTCLAGDLVTLKVACSEACLAKEIMFNLSRIGD